MRSATILVVDDDVDALVLTCAVVAAAGHRVLSATDVPQALEAARASPPDVVLLDHRLPVERGLDAVARLRREPALEGAALVLVTASRFSANEVAHLDGYVRKPWAPDDLLSAIERALAARGAGAVA